MFWERLNELIQNSQKTIYRISKETKISQSHFSQWKNGKYEASAEHRKQLAKYFGVPVSYFYDEVAPEDGVTLPPQKPNVIRVPVVGKIAAGIPMEAIQDVIDYEEIARKGNEGFEFVALQICGDSMEPQILAGDVAIIRLTPEYQTGQICAVIVNGDDATLKKVIVRSEGITLIPLNPKYPPLNYSAEEMKSLPVRIIGVLKEIRRKYS